MLQFESTGYPDVDALAQAIITNKLSFSIDMKDTELDEFVWKRVRMKSGRNIFNIPVSDDYDDIEEGRPLVLLHLIMHSIEGFEEAEDFLVWAREEGLNSSDPLVRKTWFELRDVSIQIRKLLGTELAAISSWHMEMNMQSARALREVEIR